MRQFVQWIQPKMKSAAKKPGVRIHSQPPPPALSGKLPHLVVCCFSQQNHSLFFWIGV
jgi:hypothetical protein